MTDVFHDLYDQILQCERRVHERKHVLQEVKGQIQVSKESLKEALEECNRLQKHLQEKVQEKTEVEINGRALEVQEKILEDEKHVLLEECDCMESQLRTLRDTLETEMSEFCARVEQQSSELDLSASGRHVCQKKSEELLKQLKEQETELLRDIEDYDKHRQAIADLENEKRLLHQSLRDTIQSKKDLEECLQKEKEKTEQLEEERQHIAKTPNGGEDYKRLQAELASLATEPLEEQCSQLQQKIRELNQQIHSNQQQQLRQQALQQQQHQQRRLQRQPASQSQTYGNTEKTDARPIVTTAFSGLEDEFDSDDDDYTLPDLIPRDLEYGQENTADALSSEVRAQAGQRCRPVFKPSRRT